METTETTSFHETIMEDTNFDYQPESSFNPQEFCFVDTFGQESAPIFVPTIPSPFHFQHNDDEEMEVDYDDRPEIMDELYRSTMHCSSFSRPCGATNFET
jgi:hypothetical protein